MNLKTPKSSMIAKGQSVSPGKNKLKPLSSTKMSTSFYKSRISSQESAQSSLLTKLIETQISSEEEYQNMLIRNKELQIKILQLSEQSQNLKKTFKRANKPLQEIRAKIQNGRLSLIEKQKYLQKFYVHLDSKLQSNLQSNLFGRLQKIQTALQQKYQQQKQQLYSSLASQHEKMEAANYELAKLKQYRDQLIKQYTERAMEVSCNQIQQKKHSESASVINSSEEKSTHSQQQQRSHQQNLTHKNIQKESLRNIPQNQFRKRKQQKTIAKDQVNKQCIFLRQNIQKLRKQKQIVQKDQKILKQLLNIDEEHKKHSSYILNGYKKMFTIKYRQLLSRKKIPLTISQKTQPQPLPLLPMPDIDGLQKQLNQKIAQKKILQREIEERNLGLGRCKQKLNEQIGEYSLLQQKIMQDNNNNNNNNINLSGNRQYNSRSTYTQEPSLGNHRSTYTSYQKHSEDYDQDL